MPRGEASVSELSKAIEAIYDCAIDPERWRTTLPALGKIMDSPYGALAIHDYSRQFTDRVYDFGYSQEYLRSYQEKYAALNPLPAKLVVQPIGEPATTGMLVDEEQFRHSEFFNDYLKPWGIYDSVAGVMLRSERRSALLFFNRNLEQPKYNDADLHIFRLLSPHVRRAVTISDLMDIKTLETHTLSATLDKFSAGVIIVDVEGRVLHANDAAQRMFSTGVPVRLVDNRLSADEFDSSDDLNRAVALACNDETSIGPGGIGVALKGVDGRPAVAHVLPLARGELRTRLMPQATAAVYVSNFLHSLPTDMTGVAKLFELTPAESRMLEFLMQGVTLMESARKLSITEATAKTHLSHIFSKTGVTRQSALIALIDGLIPPVKSATA